MVCAQCHSFRDIYATGFAAGENYYDYFLPILEATQPVDRDPAYWPDGRTRRFSNDAFGLWQSECYRKGGLACTACHTSNTDKATWQFAAYRPGCGGCHANSFKPEAHQKTTEGLSYNISELQNCAGACHIYTDAKLTTVAKARPAGHHKVTDGAFH